MTQSSQPQPAAPQSSVPAGGPAADVDATLRNRLAVLDTLDSLPLAEHPDVYQQVHADLQATLAEIDTA